MGVSRVVVKCFDCGLHKPHMAKGRCSKCYDKEHRKAKGSSARSETMLCACGKTMKSRSKHCRSCAQQNKVYVNKDFKLGKKVVSLPPLPQVKIDPWSQSPNYDPSDV